jgi:hypothetical protein
MADKVVKDGGNVALSENQERIVSATQGYVERLVHKLAQYFVDARPVKALLRDISPAVIEAIYSGLPAVTGFVTAGISDNAFKSPVLARLFKESINEFAKALGDILVEKEGDAVTLDIERAATDAVQKLEATPLVLDQMGFVHLAGCAKIAAWRASQPRHTRKGKNGQPEIVVSADLPSISLKTAASQNLQAAPCCFTGIDTELKKQATPPPPKDKFGGRSKSLFDIIGSLPEEEQNGFIAWFETLSGEERERAARVLREVDSIEEFRVLMKLKPELRLEHIAFIENRVRENLLNRIVSGAGKLVEGGAQKVGAVLTDVKNGAKELDESFKPMVEAQRAAVEARKARNSAPRRPRGLFGRLVDWFSGK